MLSNKQKLETALALALADEKFMGDSSKVQRAVESLTPKSTVSATFKRLQGNARRDFNDNMVEGVTGYNDLTKHDKIKEYVHTRFKSYIDDPKTSDEAKKLFSAAYPVVTEPPAELVPAEGAADIEAEAA